MEVQRAGQGPLPAGQCCRPVQFWVFPARHSGRNAHLCGPHRGAQDAGVAPPAQTGLPRTAPAGQLLAEWSMQGCMSVLPKSGANCKGSRGAHTSGVRVSGCCRWASGRRCSRRSITATCRTRTAWWASPLWMQTTPCAPASAWCQRCASAQLPAPAQPAPSLKLAASTGATQQRSPGSAGMGLVGRAGHLTVMHVPRPAPFAPPPRTGAGGLRAA